MYSPDDSTPSYQSGVSSFRKLHELADLRCAEFSRRFSNRMAMRVLDGGNKLASTADSPQSQPEDGHIPASQSDPAPASGAHKSVLRLVYSDIRTRGMSVETLAWERSLLGAAVFSWTTQQHAAIAKALILRSMTALANVISLASASYHVVFGTTESGSSTPDTTASGIQPPT